MNATELNASTQEDLFAELTNDEVQAVSGGTAYDTNYGSISPNPTTSYLGDGRWQTIFHVTRQ